MKASFLLYREITEADPILSHAIIDRIECYRSGKSKGQSGRGRLGRVKLICPIKAAEADLEDVTDNAVVMTYGDKDCVYVHVYMDKLSICT